MRTKTRRVAVLALAATMLLTLFSVFTNQANAADTYEEKLQKYAYGDSKFAIYYPTDFSKSYAPTGSDLFYADKFYNDFYVSQPEDLRKIHSDAFYDCRRLKEIKSFTQISRIHPKFTKLY